MGPRTFDTAKVGYSGQAELQQRVVISMDRSQSVVNVNAALVLPFNELFLRPAAQDETDIVFVHADMELLGRRIWDNQEFCDGS